MNFIVLVNLFHCTSLSYYPVAVHYTVLFNLLYCTSHYFTVLFCTLMYLTVLYFHFTWLYFHFCPVLSLYLVVLHFTVRNTHYCTLQFCTSNDCPPLHITVLYFILLYCPVLHFTVLYITLLNYTCLYSVSTVLYCLICMYCIVYCPFLSFISRPPDVLSCLLMYFFFTILNSPIRPSTVPLPSLYVLYCPLTYCTVSRILYFLTASVLPCTVFYSCSSLFCPLLLYYSVLLVSSAVFLTVLKCPLLYRTNLCCRHRCCPVFCSILSSTNVLHLFWSTLRPPLSHSPVQWL